MSHTDAVLDLLNADLPATRQAYPMGKVPSPRPDSYVEVTVSRRYGGLMRGGGRKDSTGWRVLARTVAQTEGNARRLSEIVSGALEYAELALSGRTTTPVQFETEDPIVEDDGWYSGATVWTYVINFEETP